MKQKIKFSDLDFEITLSNEEESDHGMFISGRERGTTFDDISIEIDLSDFCNMTPENLDGLQRWTRGNAEIHIRAAVQKESEEYKKQEIAREERRARNREIKKENKGKKEGFVYLVAADNGLHKIGKSINVDSRVNEFGVKLPMKTWLVHSFKSDQYDKAEIQLHEMFSDKRSHGEWFNLAPEDVQYFCTIQDGQL